MSELTIGVNWLAVGITTFLCFGLGGLWYSPIMFGVKWVEGVGVAIEDGASQPVAALLVQLVGTCLFAWLVALAMGSGAMPLAKMIALTTSVLLVASGLFGDNSLYAALEEGAFVVAMFTIVVLCHEILKLSVISRQERHRDRTRWHYES